MWVCGWKRRSNILAEMPVHLFENLQYLINGTSRQQAAYHLLSKHKLMETLQAFDPVLAGTIPINIDIENSDLDIICCFTDKYNFKMVATKAFGGFEDFELADTLINGQETVIINFIIEGWPVEVFGQYVPSRQQYAYRHMLMEHQLLQHYGEAFRQQIITLKKQGYKTEPAFAKALGLSGNPYQALLNPELLSGLKTK
ncbi:DUF4269 domain-containing protein [Mucilaginibacter aquaedulcis]|uniref:DUF4269 domain-containing protein n=1 Tax=Mucilaginibacter aquaedulcis TaxID=1187081 RepID=UPI003F499C27